jgi:glutamate receptor, ionotropic, invertebrate
MIAHILPYEKKDFTLINSFWFIFGSLYRQSVHIQPNSTSIKLISCIWSFFCLILVISYKANLAAFLTSKRLNEPIENIEQLSIQSKIKYGTVGNGTTQTFFQVNNMFNYRF